MLKTSAASLREAFSRHRIASTRVLSVLLVPLVLLTGSRWAEGGFAAGIMDLVGLLLVGASSYGRLWTLLFVSGHKNQTLVTEGPYSVVRNPLYVFSFIGAIGVGFSAESLIVVAVLAGAFISYYPMVILKEEKHLIAIHGEKFLEYARRTPRFLPNLSLYKQPETCVIRLKKYQRDFLDATVFVWLYGLLQLVARMHDSGILPTLIRIP